MFTRGCGRFLAGVACLGLIACVATGQEVRQARKSEPRDGFITRLVHLMPPVFAAELNLNAQQKGEIKKLSEEFAGKRRDVFIKTGVKVMTIIEDMRDDQEGELAPVLAICHEITGGLLESRRTRM